jgi:hypothetical protein
MALATFEAPKEAGGLVETKGEGRYLALSHLNDEGREGR